MAGGTPEHGVLAMQVAGLLRERLPRCTQLSSDVRVRIEATGLSTYPDLSLVCGPLERSTVDRNAVINPTLIVEVTSDSTEDYDRGDKLSHYRQLKSLQAVLLVSHRGARLTICARGPEGWSTTDVRAGELAEVQSLSLSLPVDDVFASLQNL
jgi:Uma2 family endonuclease